MKKTILMSLLISSFLVIGESIEKSSIGEQYLSFLTMFINQDDFSQEADRLLSPAIRKIVNSRVICKNRDELLQQMQEVKETYGVESIRLLESFPSQWDNCDIIHWEIDFKDNSCEVVMTILKYDTAGLIVEISEVFGEKEIYQWPEKKAAV